MSVAASAITIEMPRLSDGMTEGTIVRWLVPAGRAVTTGEPLAEIETDKATAELEAPADGILVLHAAEGATVPVGDLIASLRDSDALPAESDKNHVPLSDPPADQPEQAPRQRASASPVARRIAAKRGVELGDIRGSGPNGRIVKADVLSEISAGERPVTEPAAAEAAEAKSDAVAQPPAPAADFGKGTTDRRQPSRVQALIARRMAESRATIPDFTVSTVVGMDAAVELRSVIKRESGRVHPSINDLVIKAAATALVEHPHVNGAYVDGAYEAYSRINIGIAVDAGADLVVPTIFDADRKTITEIAIESRNLAGRVRDGSITARELSAGTFTISNLGMAGVSSFQPIVTASQAAILAVGQLSETPVVRDGAVVVGWSMTLSLTSDHRLVYGAKAAAFLASVRRVLESPVGMLI